MISQKNLAQNWGMAILFFSSCCFPMPKTKLAGVPADILDYEVTKMTMEELHQYRLPNYNFSYIRTENKTNKKWPFILFGYYFVEFSLVVS